jgi:hypothetical protein
MVALVVAVVATGGGVLRAGRGICAVLMRSETHCYVAQDDCPKIETPPGQRVQVTQFCGGIE